MSKLDSSFDTKPFDIYNNELNSSELNSTHEKGLVKLCPQQHGGEICNEFRDRSLIMGGGGQWVRKGAAASIIFP
jgi:hypothetical protein